MADSHDNAELMYVKCAYCGKWLDVKPGKMNRISHAICPECFDREMQKRKSASPRTTSRKRPAP